MRKRSNMMLARSGAPERVRVQIYQLGAIAHFSGLENSQAITVANVRVDWPTMLEVTLRAGRFCSPGVAQPRHSVLVAGGCRPRKFPEFYAGYDPVPSVDFKKKFTRIDAGRIEDYYKMKDSITLRL